MPFTDRDDDYCSDCGEYWTRCICEHLEDWNHEAQKAEDE